MKNIYILFTILLLTAQNSFGAASSSEVVLERKASAVLHPSVLREGTGKGENLRLVAIMNRHKAKQTELLSVSVVAAPSNSSAAVAAPAIESAALLPQEPMPESLPAAVTENLSGRKRKIANISPSSAPVTDADSMKSAGKRPRIKPTIIGPISTDGLTGNLLVTGKENLTTGKIHGGSLIGIWDTAYKPAPLMKTSTKASLSLRRIKPTVISAHPKKRSRIKPTLIGPISTDVPTGNLLVTGKENLTTGKIHGGSLIGIGGTADKPAPLMKTSAKAPLSLRRITPTVMSVPLASFDDNLTSVRHA